MPADDKVLIGLTHATDEPENVLIAYLMGVEARRAGKQALLWLTKDAVALATEGFIDKISVPGAPTSPSSTPNTSTEAARSTPALSA